MSQSYEPKQKNEQSLPNPCLGGCGYFGRDDQRGYCSLCYQKCVSVEQRPEHEQSEKSALTPEINDNDVDMKEKIEQKSPQQPTKKQEPNKKHRCWKCQKKIPLAGRFDCKCGYVFCSAHRFPDLHECNFDYKAAHKQKLDEMNPVVAPSKVEKI